MEMSMRKRIGAVSTVEAAVVMSVALLCPMLILLAGFYLHDLNILSGAAHESAQVGAEWKRMDERRSVQGYFQNRISGKLLYFSGASCLADQGGAHIRVQAAASSGRMRVSVSALAASEEPETEIRKLHEKE